jgi:hypothetical protein
MDETVHPVAGLGPADELRIAPQTVRIPAMRVLSTLVVTGLGAVATSLAPTARANDWSVGIGIGLPGVVVVSPTPGYYAPPPPRYYVPAYYPPGYYYPPRYYRPPVDDDGYEGDYHRHHEEHHHHHEEDDDE